ncbi:MAG: hypothetical protein ACYC0B_06780 [Gemmatimonadaceae bacterium]
MSVLACSADAPSSSTAARNAESDRQASSLSIEWSDEIEAETRTDIEIDLTPTYSRCPETVGHPGGETFINPSSTLRFQTIDPDPPLEGSPGDYDLIYWEIPLTSLRFYQYASRAVTTSTAIFRLTGDLFSNNVKWSLPPETPITIRCIGTYAPDLLGAVTSTKWVGRMTVTDLSTATMVRAFINDEGPGTTESTCDDPFTDEIEEEPCDPSSTGASVTGTGSQEPVQVTTGSKYMCDVTYWYQRDYAGGPWRFLNAEVHSSTCAWETIVL